MTKRANGEGNISKYKFDEAGKCILWRAILMIGYNEEGKRKYKNFYGKTQKEVKEKLDNYKREMLLTSSNIDYDKLTVQDYYYMWLMDHKKTYKPTSFKEYEGIYRLYIKDSIIGNTYIKKLNQSTLKRHYSDLMSMGKSPQVIIKINTKLKTCLNSAVRDDIIIKNVCSLVELPKYTKIKKREVLTLEEQCKFCEYIKGHNLELLFLTALCTGMRLSELLGLKWNNIDFKNCTISITETLQKVYVFGDDINEKRLTNVQQTPKTDTSTDIIPLPSSLIPKLKAHRLNQIKNKMLYGESYIISDYVFTDEIGKTIDNKRPNRTLQTILKKLDITPIKFHGLRKTYATRLFENGVPPKTVQTLLRHADFQTTMNIYTEVMEDVKLKAVDTLNSIFNF